MVEWTNYMTDLVSRLRENANDAAQRACGLEDKTFELGRVMAYGEVLSVMQGLAESFGIPLERMGLHDFDLVSYLTSIEPVRAIPL